MQVNGNNQQGEAPVENPRDRQLLNSIYNNNVSLIRSDNEVY